MGILSGLKKTRRYRKTDSGYVWQSEDTHESSVIFDDGTTLTDKIGAIEREISTHRHTASDIGYGMLQGQVMANEVAVSTLEISQIRNVSFGTEDLEAGVSQLKAGEMYFSYEPVE